MSTTEDRAPEVAVLEAPRPIRGAKDPASLETAPVSRDSPGETTDPEHLGHYRILGEIGRGGMGVVYAARDTRLDRKVAIKKLRAKDHADQQRRLMREAMAMAKLSHPNVIPIYEIGEHEDSTFIVMEYIEGKTLWTWLQAPRSRAEILTVFKAAARGLIAAHVKGLVHRDFKPDNVMLGEDGRVRVMDFGLARASPDPARRPPSPKTNAFITRSRRAVGEPGSSTSVSNPASTRDPLTQTGSQAGTPAYMSPEQLRGDKLSPTSDQFSFCVALYEALYRQRPFPSESLGQMSSAVLLGEIRKAPRDTTVPDWLRAIVCRGLQPEPEHRFESMQTLLDAIIAGELAHDADTREPPRYVFVAHHGTDKQAALRLCEGLLDHGVRPWIDAWDLPPATAWRRPLERALSEAPAVLVCHGPSGWDPEGYENARTLQARMDRDPTTVYRVGLPGASPIPRPVDEHGERIDLDDERWDDAIVELARRIGVDRDRADWLAHEAARAGIPESELSPYRGLEAFHERDARWMHGREQETGELLTLIRAGETRFLTVIGASGSGKSSLLMAGVCPALRNGVLGDGRRWTLAYLRPGVRPCESLARALVSLQAPPKATSTAGDGREIRRLRDELLANDDTLRAVMSRINRTSLIEHHHDQSPPGKTLLVIDQLEELFTEAGLGSSQEAPGAMAFVRNLLEATQAVTSFDAGLWVVATMRADFVQRSLEIGLLARAIKGGTYFALPPMGERQIRAAIERPARRVGFRVEPKLVDTLVTGAAERAGQLPLLQHVLHELWQRRDPDARALTHATYAQTGGLEGAIARAAERALEGLVRERGEQMRLVTRQIMTRLVHLGTGTAGDTRRLARADELGDDADVRHVLDAFVRGARVLVAGEREGVEVFEIAHEALLREWTTLVRWLDADRETLRLRQELAKSAGLRGGRSDREYLWGHGRVEEAKRLLTASMVELNAIEQEFLADSERAVRSQTLRIRAAVVGLLIIAFVVVLTVLQKNMEIRTKSDQLSAQKVAVEEKNKDLEDKERRQEHSLSVQRGLRAQMLIGQNRESDALRLAVQAAGIHRPNQPPPPEAIRALERVLADDAIIIEPRVVLDDHDNDVITLAYSPTGERLVTASKDRALAVWDPNTGDRLATMANAEGYVVALAFSPEGDRLSTIDTDGNARVWNPRAGELIRAMKTRDGGHGVDLAYSFAGRQLATADRDRGVSIWNPRTGNRVATLGARSGSVRAIAYAPDDTRLATANADGNARVWNPHTGELVATLADHDGAVLAIAYSADGRRLATASADSTARVWDPHTGKLIATLRGHDHDVTAIAFSPDGAYLATTSADKNARVWNPKSGLAVATMEGHEDSAVALAYAPDGTRLATASLDRTARVWDARTGDHIATMEGHDNYVNSLAYSPDGAHLATTSLDDTARVWDLHAYDPIATLKGHESLVSALAYSPDGTRLATAGFDNTVRVWDPRSGDLIATLLGHDNDVFALAYSPDGTRLASASADKTACIWDPTTGKRIATLEGHERDIGALAYSPDGARLATASLDSTVRIWDLASVRLVATLEGHEGDVRAVAYSPSGSRLATASVDNTARIWDPDQGDLLTILTDHGNDVLALAYSPDGARLATTSADKTTRVWDSNTGKLLATMVGHEGDVVALTYCPAGDRLATASTDKTARVWDAHTGELLATMSHDNLIYAVTCSADGTRLATASKDKTARVWDAHTGELVVVLQGHASELRDVAFSPDGTRVATASADFTAKIWDPVGGQLLTDLKDRVGLLQSDGSIDWPVPTSTLLRIACERLLPFEDDYSQAAEICDPLVSG
ncbi:MAG: protein kinase [Myxococcota bacterium]